MDRPKVLVLRIPRRRQKPRIGRLTLPRPRPSTHKLSRPPAKEKNGR